MVEVPVPWEKVVTVEVCTAKVMKSRETLVTLQMNPSARAVFIIAEAR